MSINFNYNYPQLAREAGFRLRQYKDGPIDWRILGSLETERLLQDQRLEQIDAVLSHLSEAPLACILDTHILDSGIAKYFVVSQFAIQYLLFCRKFLDETVRDLRDAHAESQMDVAKLRKSLAEANNEILTLHKKITQIEAIHEVVYPCHLCSKSFISNDALNIHISRRHANARGIVGGSNATGAVSAERRLETPALPGGGIGGGTKEREHNDINLINTIKLELEIKQLKERLNNAERDIRERSAVDSKRATPRRQRERERLREPEHEYARDTEHEPEREQKKPEVTEKIVKNVAIQSELLETKEQDDTATHAVDSEELRERKEQLAKLQQRIHDFEAWRATQQANNEESIAEINKKLNEIVQTLEDAKAKQPVTDTAATEQSELTLQRHVSPSVDELERLLTQKVVEIGQKSAEKLEEFARNMEVSYRGKLQELEQELKKRSTAQVTTKATKSEDSTSSNGTPEPKPTQSTRVKRDAALNVEPKAKSGNETYLVMAKDLEQQAHVAADQRPAPLPRSRVKREEVKVGATERKSKVNDELHSLSVESNRTFVKAEQQTAADKDSQHKARATVTQNDSTDVTESLDSASDSDSSVSSRKTEAEQSNLPQSQERPEKPTDAAKILESTPKERREKPKATPKPPKPCTRKDAQHIVSKYYATYGLEAKSKCISTAAMKRLHAEHTERRNQLKQKHPHFYATRNKIKRLVDKLCSTKLPAPVEVMLKNTAPLKPLDNFRTERLPAAQQLSASDVESFEALEVTSTPMQTPQRDQGDDFKQRLERILASPMRRPGANAGNTLHNVQVAAQVHKAAAATAPVPLARKRVMFSTHGSNNMESVAEDGATMQ